MPLHYEIVSTAAELTAAVRTIGASVALAVDLESEWNCHRYGVHLCLIQVADEKMCWLIDAVTIDDLRPIFDVLEDPAILKVFHDPQSDFLLLDRLYRCRPRTIFDTAKAAQLLGYERFSLAALLQERFNATKEEGCQAADWNRRPLSEKMLEYAARDVYYLLRLKDQLRDELREQGRLTWHREECAELENIRYQADPQPHLRIKGSRHLEPRQQLVLRNIFALREQLASELDKPPYYIIANKKMVEMAQKPAPQEKTWRNLKGVHPKVRRRAELFSAAVTKALEEKMPPLTEDRRAKTARRYSQSRTREREKLLAAIQQQVKKDYDIHQIVLSMTTLKRIAAGDTAGLRDWQREAILASAERAGIDISADFLK